MDLEITEIIDPLTVWEIRHCDVKTESGAIPAYKIYKQIEYKLNNGEVIYVDTCKCRDEYNNKEKGFASFLYYNLIRQLTVDKRNYKEQADEVIRYCIELFELGYKRVKIYHPSLYVPDGKLIRDYITTKIRSVLEYEKLVEFDKVVRFYD